MGIGIGSGGDGDEVCSAERGRGEKGVLEGGRKEGKEEGGVC